MFLRGENSFVRIRNADTSSVVGWFIEILKCPSKQGRVLFNNKPNSIVDSQVYLHPRIRPHHLIIIRHYNNTSEDIPNDRFHVTQSTLRFPRRLYLSNTSPTLFR
jgi:hypothetical protein